MITKLSTYITENTDPYKNLAMEAFLTFQTEARECILFLWQNQRTVVIGKNQNAWKECKVHQLEQDGGYLARRLSGGGAVFHDLGNLNFTFCVREEDYDVAKQTEVILRAVQALGIHAEKTGRNDITANGRKFSGHAFYKSKGFCYHHGTLLVDVDQSKMAEYLNVSAAKLQSKGVDSVRSRTVNLKELCPSLTLQQLKEQLLKAFEEVYGVERSEEISEERLNWEQIKEAETHFSSWEWKYGRKIPFDHCIEQRFSWGNVEIQFHVTGGVVQDVKVYSDAMDENLSESLQKSWMGCPYGLEELCAKLECQKPEIREDISNLLRQQF